MQNNESREILESLHKLDNRMGRVEEKLDFLSEGMPRCSENKTRIRALERAVSTGHKIIVGTVMAMIAVVIKVMVK
jgi:hypothetical protein